MAAAGQAGHGEGVLVNEEAGEKEPIGGEGQEGPPG